MKQEDTSVKQVRAFPYPRQEEGQFYIPCPVVIPYPYVSSLEQYHLLVQQLSEENQRLRLQLSRRLTSNRPLTHEELQDEIYKMVDYLMRNLHLESKEQIFQYQKRFPNCLQKRTLKSIFFQIFTRYLQASKTKEEMIKFVIRKCLKNSKSLWQFQKYEFKKMNSRIIQSLFDSPDFRLAYSSFLNQFLRIANEENENKIRKYVQFLVNLILTNDLKNALEYKRFPWLTEWINQSYQIAQQLHDDSQNSHQKSAKKQKKLQKDYLKHKV